MASVAWRPSRLLFALTVLAIAAAVATAYRGTLSNDFVYDDRFLITGNTLLHRPFDLRAVLGSSFWEHTPLSDTSYYRPVVITSFVIDATIGGFKPWIFHLTNLLLHVANTTLVAILVRVLGGGPAIAAGAALLFGLHPVNTEPVVWVVGRCDLLALFFGLIALALALDERSTFARRCPAPLRSALSAIALLLALLSKESAIAVLVVIGAQHWAVDQARPRRLWRLMPHVAIVALYAVIRLIALGRSPVGMSFLLNPLSAEQPLVRLWTTLDLFGRYLGKLVFPWHLSADYGFAVTTAVRSPFTPTVLGSVLALAGLLLLGHRARGRLPLASFGVAMFLGSTGVVLLVALMGTGAVFAERYLYMASVGFVVLGCVGLGALAARLPASLRGPGVGVGVLLIAGLAFARVSSRVPEWRDDLSLFQATVATAPDSAMAHNNLANAYWHRGDAAKTRVHCARALEIYPEFPHPLMCLGELAMARGSVDEALGHFRRAAALGHPEALLSLGDTYIALGRYQEARQALLAGWRRTPSQARYLTQLGIVSWKLERPGDAVVYWKHALRTNPGEPLALFYLGTYHERRNEHGLARHYFGRFLALDLPGMDLYKTYARRALERNPAAFP